MQITHLTCSACGANRLIEVEAGTYECEYCKSRYRIETDARTGRVRDAKVNGNMQYIPNAYAVHDGLTVKGNMNQVTIVTTATNATHVGTLTVKGNMNQVTVVLLDGAEYEIRGNMNQVVDER